MRRSLNFISKISRAVDVFWLNRKTKYFCIGAGKTGTTSLGKAFEDLGFVVGNQRQAELLSKECFLNNYEPLIRYCRTAEVFQDVPFCFSDNYKRLDEAFPKSKFILSLRDTPEQWYNSLVKFHSKVYGNGKLPDWEKLKRIDYVYEGWTYENRKNEFKLTENDDPYDRGKLIEHYKDRNREILEYFKGRQDDLLVINLAERGSYQRFCKFLGIDAKRQDFPWENRTEEITK